MPLRIFVDAYTLVNMNRARIEVQWMDFGYKTVVLAYDFDESASFRARVSRVQLGLDEVWAIDGLDAHGAGRWHELSGASLANESQRLLEWLDDDEGDRLLALWARESERFACDPN